MVYFNLWKKIFDLLNTRESVIEFVNVKKKPIERRYLISGITISRHALSQKIGKPK
jgi:hypothetical protein